MKRFFSYLLTVALLLTMLPMSVSAADAPVPETENMAQDTTEMIQSTNEMPVSNAGSTRAAVPTITPKYATLSFEGATIYNVYYTVKNLGSVGLDDMGLIIFDSKLFDGTMDDAAEVIPGAVYGNGEYMVHTNGIPAKNLGDMVYFKVYAKLADGSYAYSALTGYNAIYYTRSIIDTTDDEEMKALCLATLDYGAAAQMFFNYKTDSLMNACFTKNEHKDTNGWTVEKPASFDAAGSEYCICSVCGFRMTREIPKLTVSSIAVTANPDKTSYFNQETFDPTGMVVTAFLSDGSSMAVTDYTVNKTVLSPTDTAVTVSFAGYTANVKITVSEYTKLSVSQIITQETGTLWVVEGYYAGVAEEGPSTDKELLIKDIHTDDIIAVRNVPYGAFPDYGYKAGDKIQLIVTLKLDGTVNTPNKRYLDFSSENGTIESTIVSTGNKVTYQLNNTVKVSSWAQMQELFAVGAIAEYTYVEFTGAIYFNRYAGSDGVDISRMHMNSAATGVSGIRTDGSRTVSLRDNVMAANLGADWVGLFFGEMPATGQYPGTRLKGKLIGLYTGGNNYYLQLTVLDESWVELVPFDNYDVVTEVADAFYQQGAQIQYDQTQSRRNIDPSPEDATAQNTIYLDCSSFVNAVYKEAFGVNVMDNTKTPSTANYTTYAEENLGTAVDVLGYWENADYTTASAISALLSQVRGQLQVGDLLVYRHGETSGSSGHVIMYIGNDTFIHCTGSSYNYSGTPSTSYDKGTTAEKTNGAVQLLDADDVFTNTSSSRYLFKVTASDTVYNFCLLRPMNRGLTPTEESKNRMTIQGVSVEKSVSVDQYNAVNAGDTVTYTVTLKNTGSIGYTGVTLEETLPNFVSYVSGTAGMTASGQTVTWVGAVPANTTVTLTYSVKVDSSADSGTLIQSSETTLNGVEINDLTNTVSGMSDSELAAIAQNAKDKADNAVKNEFTNPMLFVQYLYDGYVGNYQTVSSALAAVIDTTNNTYKTDTDLSGILVPNLYGGLDIKSGFVNDVNRSRLIVEAYLEVGDIILAEYDGKSIVFVYVGDSTLIGIDSPNDTCTTYTISGDAYSSANILVTLIAYDRYAILRPSMAA